MFREMRRRKQGLAEADCKRILREEKRGVLAINGDDGYPYAIPMNFYFCDGADDGTGAHGAIYLHSAMVGHKVDALRRCDKVCFTTWNRGVQKEGDWSYFVDSVVAFGRVREVADEAERTTATKRFGMKYYPSEGEVDAEMERDMGRMLLLRIDIEHLSGKHVHER